MPPNPLQYVITVEEQPVPAAIAVVHAGLTEFNRGFVGDDGYQRLAVLVHDEAGQPLGGLVGTTYYDWLCIELVWLAERARGQGIGSQVLAAAEALAIQRGCRHAHLDTSNFRRAVFTKNMATPCSVNCRTVRRAILVII